MERVRVLDLMEATSEEVAAFMRGEELELDEDSAEEIGEVIERKDFEVIYTLDDDENFPPTNLREMFATREEALEWISEAKKSPYMSNFDLVDLNDLYGRYER